MGSRSWASGVSGQGSGAGGENAPDQVSETRLCEGPGSVRIGLYSGRQAFLPLCLLPNKFSDDS